MRPLLNCLVLCGMSLLAACTQKIDANDYFPTTPGYSWRYATTYEFPDEKRTDWLTIETIDPRPVYFESGTKKLPVRRTSLGTDYYIQREEVGIFRAARRLIVENKPVVDPQARMILPQGANLREGFIWNQTANPYAVKWKPPFQEMNASIKPFDMLFEVTSLDDTVETPAGKFDKCIRLDGYGKMVVYADPRTGYNEVQITQTEWYAPGVGLVKLVRKEPLKLDIITGGSVTMQLTRFGPTS